MGLSQGREGVLGGRLGQRLRSRQKLLWTGVCWWHPWKSALSASTALSGPASRHAATGSAGGRHSSPVYDTSLHSPALPHVLLVVRSILPLTLSAIHLSLIHLCKQQLGALTVLHWKHFPTQNTQ